MASRENLIRAVDLAIAGDWEAAHGLAQSHEGDPAADWLHAVLHKIEGDGQQPLLVSPHAHSFDEYPIPRSVSAIRDLLSR
jgi:hypothetical protein